MKQSKRQKSINEEPGICPGNKDLDSFLFPKMLGSFQPAAIRKWPVEKLRERYLIAFNASMGNHSLSMFFCCWNQDQFEAAMTDAFEKKISRLRGELADRAMLIMHKGMGLVGDGVASVPPTVTAAMAKVVENMKNPDGTLGVQKKAYKLTVNGLQSPAPGPSAAVVAKRGPGRPRIAQSGPVGPMEKPGELP